MSNLSNLLSKIIRRVKSNSPGQKAGLIKGDIIVGVEDYLCDDMSLNELFVLLSQQVAKSQFSITVKTKSNENRSPLLGTADSFDGDESEQQSTKKCKIS